MNCPNYTATGENRIPIICPQLQGLYDYILPRDRFGEDELVRPSGSLHEIGGDTGGRQPLKL